VALEGLVCADAYIAAAKLDLLDLLDLSLQPA
jgi:hypothetical protein